MTATPGTTGTPAATGGALELYRPQDVAGAAAAGGRAGVVRHRTRGRRWWAPALLALAAALLAVVAGTGVLRPQAPAAHRAPAADAGTEALVTQPLAPEPARPPVPNATPVRLRVPAIGVDSELSRLELGADGTLQSPTDYDRVGWYAAGTLPGQIGPAVLAGHVDSWTGPAVFARLSELHAGDLVEVVRTDRSVRFRVDAVTQYPKDRFPTADVYGPTPDSQLRLITCGGVFDESSRSYRDNIVVYATAA